MLPVRKDPDVCKQRASARRIQNTLMPLANGCASAIAKHNAWTRKWVFPYGRCGNILGSVLLLNRTDWHNDPRGQRHQHLFHRTQPGREKLVWRPVHLWL